jgi:acetylornithine deacetylase
VAFARALIDIDSTTGREGAVAGWLADELRGLGYRVVEQPVEGDRRNVYAEVGDPAVVLSTHLDCVPPFFPSRVEDDRLFGRGSCDAKGILAAQVVACERLRAAGETRVALLFVVGEERGSEGAVRSADLARASRYLINGEPTDNRLASATRGVYRVRLVARGRAAHSSRPELGESAIEKLVTAITALRALSLPSDELLGRTHYTVGSIQGGVAPNVVPAYAEAEVMFRTVGDAAAVRAAMASLEGGVEIHDVLTVPPARMACVDGFDTAVFPFTTDIPLLAAWGTPLLYGPGSALVAHTDGEHVSIAELHQAADGYTKLVRALLHDTAVELVQSPGRREPATRDTSSTLE